MTLAHVAHRRSRARVTMYHAAGPAVPAAARSRVEAHAARHGWPLVRHRRRRARRPPLPCQPRRPLLLLQDEPVRADPRGDGRPDRLGHQPRRPADYPAGAARRGRAWRRPSVRRGRPRQGARSTRSPRALGLDDLERLPAQPCLSSRVETGIAIDPGDLAFIDAVETRLAAALGRDAVAALPRHARRRRHRAGRRAGRGRGARAPANRRARSPGAQRPDLRRRSSLPPRRGLPDRGAAPLKRLPLDWDRAAAHRDERGGALRAQDRGADRRDRRARRGARAAGCC